MKIISRYVLREVAWPCLLAFVVICFVGAGVQFRERSSQLNLDFLRVTDFARLALYFVPTLFSYTLPITFMMGILLAFGGLAQSNELIAMRAAGIPLKRLIVPVLVTGLLMSGVCLYLQAEVQPWAVKRADQFIMQELVLRGTMDALPPGKMHTFDTGDGSFRIYFSEKDAATNTLKDIDIFQSYNEGKVNIIHSKSATIRYIDGVPTVELSGSNSIQPMKDGLVSFYSRNLRITGPQLMAGALPSKRAAKTLGELFADDRAAAAEKGDRAKSVMESSRKEIAERFALPMACFAVCFCAAPLAARGGRQGRSYGFAIGVVIGLSFFLLTKVFEPSGLRSMSETILRAMAPNILLTVAGIFFLWRVDRV